MEFTSNPERMASPRVNAPALTPRHTFLFPGPASGNYLNSGGIGRCRAGEELAQDHGIVVP